jgi:CheY-like chemotaxis protein
MLAAPFERSVEVHVQDGSAGAPVTGIRVLVADDDARVRSLLATLLQAMNGVASVVEAGDGAEAVELSRKEQVDVAILDLNMPRQDGVEAALWLRGMKPSPRIALRSSDPDLLRQRAAHLELPLFDKADVDRLRAWIERQATDVSAAGLGGSGQVAPVARTLDLCCSVCGYGIACRTPPKRCPMCGGGASWIEPPRRRAGRVAFDVLLAG